MELTGQILSIIAMGVYILSFQAKKQKAIITFQMIANSLFAISFFMLDAKMGMILNIISAIRALLFMYKKQLKTDHIVWLIGFIAVYIATYAFTMVTFIKEFWPTVSPQTLTSLSSLPFIPFVITVWGEFKPLIITALLEFIPLIGMVATTLGYRAKNAQAVRVAGLVNEPAWLVYNVYSFSIGAIFCNVFSLISAIVGLVRFNKQKKA